MGFVVHDRPIVVRLRNTEFDGVEARCSFCSVGDYLAAVNTNRGSDDAYVTLLRGHLISWNLETDSGEPIPTDQVDALPPDLILSLAVGYARAASRVVRDSPFAGPDPSTVPSNGAADPDGIMTAL